MRRTVVVFTLSALLLSAGFVSAGEMPSDSPAKKAAPSVSPKVKEEKMPKAKHHGHAGHKKAKHTKGK